MLQIINLTKTYNKKAVLQSTSFSLEKGQCLGISGHNGSGKSTLLALIAQVSTPTSGNILYADKSILGNRAFMRSSIGYVPQANCLLQDLTVQETLAFWQNCYALPTANLFASGSPAQLLGLASLAKKRISSLSGGMQKRLSIAIALLHTPGILLLDEILSSLDRHYRAQILAYLQNYLANGGSIIYCSHEAEELHLLCNSALILSGGKTVYYDSIQNFPTDEATLTKLLSPPLNW